MIKLVHISDLHLGKKLHGYRLDDDQEYILNQIAEKSVEYKADGVLIAGDIFDTTQRSKEAVKLWGDFLNALNQKGLKAFIVAGNHDSGEKVAFADQVLEREGICIAGVYEGELPCHRIEKEGQGVNIYLLPYVSKQTIKTYHAEDKIDTYDDAFRVIIDKAQIDTNHCNILVAHQFVRGGKVDAEGSENLSTRTCGTVDQINSNLFSCFDYVALGHLHSPQFVGKDTKVRYSGTPLKYSKAEAGCDKSMTLLEIDDEGKIEIKEIPLVPKRDLCHLKGMFADITSLECVDKYKDKYVYVTLDDEPGTLSAPHAALHGYFDYFLKCEYVKQRRDELAEHNQEGAMQDKGFMEIFEDFYAGMLPDKNMTNEEREIVQEVAKEVGLIDED